MNPQMKRWFSHVYPGTGAFCYQSFQTPPKEAPCEHCPAVKTFAEGKSHETTIRIKSERRERYFRDHSFPIHDEKGNVTSVILLVEDVTEKLAFERELRQTQKLEAIGQLAAGIAHEINTPIQYVGDNTNFLRDSFKDLLEAFSTYDRLLQAVKNQTVSDVLLDTVEKCIGETDLPYLKEEIPRAIEQSLDGVRRVTEIVTAMRDFSHPGGDRKTLVDLNHAINNTITVARNEWKYVAEMELDLDPDLPEVLCLPGEINQVFLNIIVNAAHAIADVLRENKQSRGKISITTRKKNNSAAIYISDTGAGIPKEVQHRIFDPFFTTKGVGQGTGQGLAIAHRVIIEKHRGNLRFDTRENEGTTFIIELPLPPGSKETVC
jgi:signal transduction histidine kinase